MSDRTQDEPKPAPNHVKSGVTRGNGSPRQSAGASHPPFFRRHDLFDDPPELLPRENRRRAASAPKRPVASGHDEPYADVVFRPPPTSKSIATTLPPQQPFSSAVRSVPYDASVSWRARAYQLLLRIDMPFLLAFVIISICIAGIVIAAVPPKSILSLYSSGKSEAHVEVREAPMPPLIASESPYSVLGAPSISASTIDSVLQEYGSPAKGTGAIWITMGQRYGIDPAYALAFFVHESSAGTNPGWAGIKPDGSSTHNIGNIICAGYATCFGRFRDYKSWEEGIEDWYQLIRVEYVNGRGVHTIDQIIPIYAPSVENDVPAYVNAVQLLVNDWRVREATR